MEYKKWDRITGIVTLISVVVLIIQTIIMNKQLTLAERNQAMEDVFSSANSVCDKILDLPVKPVREDQSRKFYSFPRSKIDNITQVQWIEYKYEIEKAAREYSVRLSILSIYLNNSERNYLKANGRKFLDSYMNIYYERKNDEIIDDIFDLYNACSKNIKNIFYYFTSYRPEFGDDITYYIDEDSG